MRRRGLSEDDEDCSGGSDLPEDVVNGVAQESFPIVRRQKFGPQYRHELLKVHLSIACRRTHGKTQRESQIETDTKTPSGRS